MANAGELRDRRTGRSSEGGTRAGSEGLRTVFVIDDDPATRESIADALADEGYRVFAAGDGVEGLDRMAGFEGRGVAVIDLKMPGMDGWNLIELMRADERYRRIPIIVLTGHWDGSVKGLVWLIHKPFKLDTLLRAVRALCP